MSEALERLHKLGAQKIYEDTHIPLQQVKSLLAENFDSFHKVQLAGFLSILEREYSIELTELRRISTEELQQRKEEDKGIFVTSEVPKSNNNKLYIFIAVLLFIGVILYNVMLAKTANEGIESIDDTLIENVTSSMEPESVVLVEENSTQEKNSSTAQVVTIEVEAIKESVPQSDNLEEKVVQNSFNVEAKSKVWVGYIDTKSYKKYQKTFKGELKLDPEKSWLFLFGHAYVDFSINGQKIVFKSRNSKRFFYKNGEIRPISVEEFKELNRGRKW
jgi:hypothetical protein